MVRVFLLITMYSVWECARDVLPRICRDNFQTFISVMFNIPACYRVNVSRESRRQRRVLLMDLRAAENQDLGCDKARLLFEDTLHTTRQQFPALCL